MKIRTLLMVSSLAVISSFFVGAKEANSQQIQCDQYGKCYQLQVFCDGYGRCYQQWTPYDQNQYYCDMAAGGNQMAQTIVGASGIDCTRYGYSSEVNQRSRSTSDQLNDINFPITIP